MARTAWNSMTVTSGVSARKNTVSTAPVAKNAPETTATGRTPTRSVRKPASGFSTRAATVPGSSTIPASSAVPPQSPSTYRGSTSVTPMNDAFNRFCAMKPARYCADENIFMLTSGSSTRFCLRTNSTRKTTPKTSGAHTKGLATEKLLASENASNTPPNPKVENVSEVASRRAALSGASDGLIATTAATPSTSVMTTSKTK